MVTRNVVLTDSQDQLVQALVTSGRYQNASEAMPAGPRLLEDQEAGLLQIRAQLQEGVTQAEARDLAGGTDVDAIRRAFAAARSGT